MDKVVEVKQIFDLISQDLHFIFVLTDYFSERKIENGWFEDIYDIEIMVSEKKFVNFSKDQNREVDLVSTYLSAGYVFKAVKRIFDKLNKPDDKQFLELIQFTVKFIYEDSIPNITSGYKVKITDTDFPKIAEMIATDFPSLII